MAEVPVVQFRQKLHLVSKFSPGLLIPIPNFGIIIHPESD